MKKETQNKADKQILAGFNKRQNQEPILILDKEDVANLSPKARNDYSLYIAEVIAKDHSGLFKKLAK